MKELGRVFGLKLDERKSKTSTDEEGPDPYIDLLLEIREDLRGKGEYESADKIRDRLSENDIEVEDTDQGPEWRFI